MKIITYVSRDSAKLSNVIMYALASTFFLVMPTTITVPCKQDKHIGYGYYQCLTNEITKPEDRHTECNY